MNSVSESAKGPLDASGESEKLFQSREGVVEECFARFATLQRPNHILETYSKVRTSIESVC